MNAAGWHWHVSLRWRAGQAERVEVADLAYADDDHVVFVLTRLAQLRNVPMASVVGFDGHLVKS